MHGYHGTAKGTTLNPCGSLVPSKYLVRGEPWWNRPLDLLFATKARAFLKRAAYGRMDPLPSSIEDGVSGGVTWTSLYADESAARFSVLHVLGERRPS